MCSMAATTHRLPSAISKVATLLLFAFISNCSAQETYYIKPTPSTSCPGDSCLTLSEYAHQSREYLSLSTTTLVFMPGDHTLKETILVSDTASFTMLGRFNSTVTSIRPVGFFFRNVSHVIIHALMFTSNSSSLSQNDKCRYTFRCAVQASLVQNLEINNCTFQENYATAVEIRSSNMVLQGTNTFKNNCRCLFLRVDSCLGGGISAWRSNLSLNGNNTFVGNSAESGGGLFATRSTITASGENSFVDNSAISHRGGGGIFAVRSALRFVGITDFKYNSVKVSNGGGIRLLKSTLYVTGLTIFEGNLAHGTEPLHLVSGCGGGVFAEQSSLIFAGRTTFLNDSAGCGGGLLVYQSNMRVNGSIQFYNNSVSKYGGGACVVYSSASVIGSSTFIGNRARLGGSVYILGSNVTFSGNNTLHSSVAGKGAAITLFESILNISGNSSFAENVAKLGSVMHPVNSIALFGGNTTFSNNIATVAGSGVLSLSSLINFDGISSFVQNWVRPDFFGGLFHLSNSTLYFTGNSRFSRNSACNGGAIYAMTRSKIQFLGHSTFYRNHAHQDGGALYLTGNSKCYFWPKASVYWMYNIAGRFGGAIRILDSNPAIECEFYETEMTNQDQCFFQIPSIKFSQNATRKRLTFKYNSAGKAGTALFGGTVDKCKLSDFDPGEAFDEMTSLTNWKGDTSIVASHPFRVCNCVENHQSICNIRDVCTDDVRIRKHPGETFVISAVAVGQRCGTVPTYVRSYFDVASSGRFFDFQNIQPVGKICTNLTYTIFSSSKKETVKLYADGQCSTAGNSLTIRLALLPCPHGFMLSKSGECVCEQRLQKYTNSCNITDRTIVHDGNFWVGFDKQTEELILHPHCPFDYCNSSNARFTITSLHLQCAYNRTGLLCGSCSSGLTSVFGSSQCLQCSSHYLALLFPFALSGLLLVFLLLISKVTVSVGTISGLIFYANMVVANQDIFFVDTNQKVPISVFIAWLNLDLGITACFYEGMDVYGKTWLQFVFPIYIWSVAGVIIVLSNYSLRVTKSLGNNPVAVLATLFLLSYTKLLRNIIAGVSPTYLHYPNGTKTVWLYDASVYFLHNKHIPLFVASVLFFILFLPYTLLILLGQWLQANSHLKILSWARSSRLKFFLDAYHAPYKSKHRYWPGLLLVVRFVTLVVVATNVLGDPSVNLLTISASSLGLLAWALIAGGVYKNRCLEALEASFIINLGMLAAATYHVRLSKGNQAAVMYTSIAAAFLTFVGILHYHIYLRLREFALWQSLIKLIRPRGNTNDNTLRGEADFGFSNRSQASGAPTTSYIELREPLVESN